MLIQRIKQSFIEFWLGIMIIVAGIYIFDTIGIYAGLIGISILSGIFYFSFSPIGLIFIILCLVIKKLD